MHVPLDLECAPTFRIVPMASLLTIAEVSKRTGPVGTTSSVTQVQGLDRISEIARMLGGERSTEASMAHAREMLSLAAHAAPLERTN